MKAVFILAALVVASDARLIFSDDHDGTWSNFKISHGKVYGSYLEEQLRKEIFLNNLEKIKEHNLLYARGLVAYRLGVHQYSDMLHEEFTKSMNGFKMSSEAKERSSKLSFRPPAHVDLPKSVDWRKDGAVTPVKDQGRCGSCWAFSATGSLEGQHFRKTNKLVSLSEQNLIDCSGLYGNSGCNGGQMDSAFDYIKHNNGIDTEDAYPYVGKNLDCHYKPQFCGATDRGFVDLESGSEEQLKAAVATLGPISVAIDASHFSFQHYSSGVYDEPNCSANNLDHGVLVVGYGTTKEGLDYWIVKNSWGVSYGDEGYILMSRNKKNQCGIASMASYPLV